MKQFMTVSALFLSAACLCAHTPSFAKSLVDDVSNTTSKTVNKTGKAVKNVAEDVVQATGDGLKAAKKGTEDLLGTGNKKNTRNNRNN